MKIKSPDEIVLVPQGDEHMTDAYWTVRPKPYQPGQVHYVRDDHYERAMTVLEDLLATARAFANPTRDPPGRRDIPVFTEAQSVIEQACELRKRRVTRKR